MDDEYCDWSMLHDDLLELILKEFGSVADCVRFGAVCVSWRTVLVTHFHPSLLHPQLPLLMIPTPPRPDHTEELETLSFYNVVEGRVYKDLQIKLPCNRHCCGSSYGWLITSGDGIHVNSVELFNPFISTNNECYQKIQLPLFFFSFFPYPEEDGVYHWKKAFLSADPTTNPNDFVVVGIFGDFGRLTFWKPGDKGWNLMPVDWRDSGGYMDVIYHKGMFYMVDSEGVVSIWELYGDCYGGCGRRIQQPHTHPIKLAIIESWMMPKVSRGRTERYLVESSSGDLLMVNRLHTMETESISHSTTGFIVFKLEHVRWVRIHNLEDQMLFIGNNASISLPASEFHGGKPNHIYFTDDNSIQYDGGYCDMGVFSLDDGRIEQIHDPMGSEDYVLPAAAVWVEPTLRTCLRF